MKKAGVVTSLRGERKGSMLLMALACLAVVSAMLFGMLTNVIRDRSQTRVELQMEQTLWLLDAGVEFAKSELQHRDENTLIRESRVSVKELGANGSGVVSYRVTRETESEIEVEVVAEVLGAGAYPQLTKRSRDFTFSNRRSGPEVEK